MTRRAFSLVEVSVAIALTAVVLVPVLEAARSLRAARESGRLHTLARGLADFLAADAAGGNDRTPLERVRATAVPELMAWAGLAGVRDAVDARYGALFVTRSVTRADSASRPGRACVTVSWTHAGRERSVSATETVAW